MECVARACLVKIEQSRNQIRPVCFSKPACAGADTTQLSIALRMAFQLEGIEYR
jgi:hypothetical protein